jgi:hypothetical protein
MPIFVRYQHFERQISVKIAIQNDRQNDPFFAPYTRARVIESRAYASRFIE